MKKKIIITLFVIITLIISSTFLINLHMISSTKDRIIENGAMFEMASHNKEKVLEDTLKILKGEK